MCTMKFLCFNLLWLHYLKNQMTCGSNKLHTTCVLCFSIWLFLTTLTHPEVYLASNTQDAQWNACMPFWLILTKTEKCQQNISKSNTKPEQKNTVLTPQHTCNAWNNSNQCIPEQLVPHTHPSRAFIIPTCNQPHLQKLLNTGLRLQPQQNINKP
jgi:hypothetical protein